MKCEQCGTVNPDLARFCISCGSALPRTCPNCGAMNPAAARFCNQCGTQLQPAADSTSGTLRRGGRRTSGGPRVGASASSARNAAPDNDEPNEQRRIVSVLFADLTSSTELAEDMDPEEARALLSAFFETMTRAIHRHGGTVEKYIGDAVMAVFGLPVTHEDDPLRAVRAALDMQAALRAFNAERTAADPGAAELHIRIGINTGEVAAASGAAEGRDFLITGDPVNVAARFQQMAQPDSIVVGPRTYRATLGAVRYGPPTSVTLRGRSRPIHMWEAVGLSDEGVAPVPRPRGIDGRRTPLVGRSVELELLTALYARVLRERRPHLVTLLGMPGIGKTRLAREFVARVTTPAASTVLATADERDALAVEIGSDTNVLTSARPRIEPEMAHPPEVLEGRCPPYGEGITYWPLAEMLRTHCGIAALETPESARKKILQCIGGQLDAESHDDAEVIAAYLGATIRVETHERMSALLPSDPQQLRDGTKRAWRTFFESIAVRGSLILFVEDIHWADAALLDLLEFVAARTADVPLLLLCTARPELMEKRPDWGGGKRNYATVALEALTVSDTHRLIRELLPGDEVPERLRARISEQAEGNPFYVEEIVRMLVDRGILERIGESRAWRVAAEWITSEEVANPVIPDTIQGVLGARLDLLSSVERDVLQHASVIGRYFWPSALLHLAPHLQAGRLPALLSALEAKELIHVSEHARATVAPPGEPVYTFNHTLIREVVYSSIVRSRRAHEHARVAEWLEDLARGRETEFADLLARHTLQYYLQANLARSRNVARKQAALAKVIHYLTLAGDAARTRNAASSAEDYYTEAVNLLQDDASPENLETRVDLLTKRGDARWLVLRADDAWSDYRAALELWSLAYAPSTEKAATQPAASATPTDDDACARAAVVGPDLATTEPVNVSEPDLTQIPAEWRLRGMHLCRLLVLLPSRYASYFQRIPSHEEQLSYLQRGQRLADSLGEYDTIEYAELLTAKSFFWWSWYQRRGEFELLDALRSAREAVRILEEQGDPHGASEALDALGNVQAITTDLRGYLDSQTRRLELAQQIDDPTELVDMHVEVSQAYQMVGEYERAAHHARTALDLARAADSETLMMHALRSLVMTHFEWDHWEEAISAGNLLLQHSGQTTFRNSRHQQWVLLAMATAHARRGERDESDALARQAAELPHYGEMQYVEVYRARLALAEGARQEARGLLVAALECRSGRHSLAMLLAELAELAASTGDAELYERYGAQALELGWRSGARKALAQAIRARAIVALSEERWDDALTDAENALARYRDLGTQWEAARTQYVLGGLYHRRQAGGDAERAEDELRQALGVFESLHAVRDIARTRTALSGSDVRLP